MRDERVERRLSTTLLKKMKMSTNEEIHGVDRSRKVDLCSTLIFMDLVLFGIQGSGKGTQAKKFAAEFGYDIFEAGGELRKIAASGSELGETVKSYIDIGKLVPFEIIMEVLEQAVSSRDRNQKILFDGIPRDENQKKSFDEIMENLGRDF